MHFFKDNKTGSIFTCILVIAISVVIAIGVGGVFSKYAESVLLNSVDLTVSGGQLAESFALQEHRAVQNSDGTYSLGTELVKSNSYRVLPGVSLPKDPFFTIVGKSKIAAYLYVEVVENTGSSGLTYALNNNWKALGINGANGGKVYVYTGGNADAVLVDENFSADRVYILKDNQINVSSENKSSVNVSVSFYGYLAQASLADTANEVYITCFGGGD